MLFYAAMAALNAIGFGFMVALRVTRQREGFAIEVATSIYLGLVVGFLCKIASLQ